MMTHLSHSLLLSFLVLVASLPRTTCASSLILNEYVNAAGESTGGTLLVNDGYFEYTQAETIPITDAGGAQAGTVITVKNALPEALVVDAVTLEAQPADSGGYNEVGSIANAVASQFGVTGIMMTTSTVSTTSSLSAMDVLSMSADTSGSLGAGTKSASMLRLGGLQLGAAPEPSRTLLLLGGLLPLLCRRQRLRGKHTWKV